MAETDFNDRLLQHIKSGKNTEVVLSLLRDANAEPCRYVGKYKSTLLHLAAEHGNEHLAQYLVDLGADVDAQNNIGETPLTLAVKHEREEIAKLLLKANADVFVHDIFEKCAFARASDRMEGIRGSISRLILDSVTIESMRKSPHVNTQTFRDNCLLSNFASLKNVELMRFLLENGSRVNDEHPRTGVTALHLAVRHLDVETVKLLLEYGANVNARDEEERTPLAFFPSYCDEGEETCEIVKILLNAGATDRDRDEPLESMLWNASGPLLRTILRCKSIDWYAKTENSSRPIDHLMENKNIDVIYEELKNLGIELNTCFSDKTTLLHREAANGDFGKVKFLVDHGADVNARDSDNFMPLHMAVYPMNAAVTAASAGTQEKFMRQLDCIALLLKSGADPQLLTDNIKYSYIEIFDTPAIVDFGVKLMSPVLHQLALEEASGRAIDFFVLNEIVKRLGFEAVYNSDKRELEEMKTIEIDESVSLFDFLTAKRISMYAENNVLVSNLTRIMNEREIDSYYYRRLRQSFLKLARLLAINDVFVVYYNVSTISIAERIFDYAYD